MRSVERTVAEVLLPALELAERRPNGARRARVRLPLGHRLAASRPPPRRRAPPATEGVLLLDSGSPLGVEAVHVQALELFLRRAGLRVLLLSAGLAEGRFRSALRALDPAAVVICGSEARLDVLGGPLRALRTEDGMARLYGYRAARLVAGRDGVPSLGTEPGEATGRAARAALGSRAPRSALDRSRLGSAVSHADASDVPPDRSHGGERRAASHIRPTACKFRARLRELCRVMQLSVAELAHRLRIADEPIAATVRRRLPTASDSCKFAPICGGSTSSRRDHGSKPEVSQRERGGRVSRRQRGVAAQMVGPGPRARLPDPGGQRRYAPSDLEEFLASMRQPARRPAPCRATAATPTRSAAEPSERRPPRRPDDRTADTTRDRTRDRRARGRRSSSRCSATAGPDWDLPLLRDADRPLDHQRPDRDRDRRRPGGGLREPDDDRDRGRAARRRPGRGDRRDHDPRRLGSSTATSATTC